jgi:hypothetical protein
VANTCRFGCGPAIARYAMDRGCVCFPDDREQDLCAQHVVRATPLGGMELIEAYFPNHPLVTGVEAAPCHS